MGLSTNNTNKHQQHKQLITTMDTEQHTPSSPVISNRNIFNNKTKVFTSYNNNTTTLITKNNKTTTISVYNTAKFIQQKENAPIINKITIKNNKTTIKQSKCTKLKLTSKFKSKLKSKLQLKQPLAAIRKVRNTLAES